MKLHYSQTLGGTGILADKFYYLMKLHYSQTSFANCNVAIWFYYLMKLHYSQTKFKREKTNRPVLLPYEITLLSNVPKLSKMTFTVLLPYEITLLSNSEWRRKPARQFYYLMKLHYSQTTYKLSLKRL